MGRECCLYKQFLPIIALFSILSVVYWLNLKNSNETIGDNCYFDSDTCILVKDDERFSVSFDRFPVELEEELNLSFDYPEQYVVKQAWVEGVNMFMGRSLVDFNGASFKQEFVSDAVSPQNGALFLGSCSEPKMRWRLVVELAEVRQSQVQGNSTFKLYYYFQTDSTV